MANSEDQARDYPPRLYAEGASNLESKEINRYTYMGDFPNVREAIGRDVWEYLRHSPLGIIVKLAERKSVWSGRTVHYLLCRQLRVYKKEIWSLVGDEPIRFSLLEFGEITGLNTDPVPTESFEPDQYKAFWELLRVPLGQGPKLCELRVALEDCPAWSYDQRKWLGLLLLQAMGLYALHPNSRIPFESAKRVFDDEAMRTYPWGRTAYEVVFDSIKMLNPQGRTYTLNGLTDVLLVWAYESVTCFGERFGRVINEQEVPLFRWGGNRTRKSFDTVITQEIIAHREVRVRKMVMKDSVEEMFPQWPDESDDTQLVNLITDIYTGRFVRGFWVTLIKRKQMKAEPKAEPPIKKQKRVKDEADVERKGASEKEGTEVMSRMLEILEKISSKLDNHDNRFEYIEERLNRYESRDNADLVRVAVEEYFSKAPVQQSLSLPPPPPPPPQPKKSFPQASVTSPPAKEPVTSPPAKPSVTSPPAKGAKKNLAFGTAAQATDVDFVSVSPSKDPAVGRPGKIIFKVNKSDAVETELEKKKAKEAELKAKDAELKENGAELKKKQAEERKEAAELKRKEAAELKRKEAAELRKKKAEEKKKAAEMKKKAKAEIMQEAPTRTTRRGVITVPVPPPKPVESDSDVADVTDQIFKSLEEVLPESDEEEVDRIRSERIKKHREKNVQLASNGRALLADNAPSPPVFPRIGDNGTTCMRKGFEPSPGIYDPLAPVDPDRLEKLQKHMEKYKDDFPATETAAHEGEFYRIMVTPRPWPKDKYGWLWDDHISAYMRVLMKRSMRDPSPFWSKRIAFIDVWFLTTWVHDYKQYKLKPSRMKFKDNGYEELINGRMPADFQTNLKWFEDVDHLYGVLQTGGDHWVAFHVDLLKEKIDCYDPIIGQNTLESQDRMVQSFKPLTQMLPAMLNDNIPSNIRPHKNRQFAFRRRTGKYIPQNVLTGDCGVYSLKFMECLALGVTFDGINDKNIQGIRMKMAADILAESGMNDVYNQFEEFNSAAL